VLDDFSGVTLRHTLDSRLALSCATPLKNAHRFLYNFLIDVPSYEYDSCSVIVAGPFV
jgi:hypothetical protein